MSILAIVPMARVRCKPVAAADHGGFDHGDFIRTDRFVPLFPEQPEGFVDGQLQTLGVLKAQMA